MNFFGDRLSELLWGITRPQQSLFQGIDAGRKAFEYDRANILPSQAAREVGSTDDLDVRNLLSGYASAMKSLPSAALSGAKAWFSPSRDDVRGEQLTEEPISGALLELTADPLAFIPGPQSQKLGTMWRTGDNMMNLWQSGKPSWQAIKDYGVTRALTDLDISAAPRAADDLMPTVIRNEGDVIPLLRDLGKSTTIFPDRATVGGSVFGKFPADSRMLAVDVTQDVPPWVHESAHYARGISDELPTLLATLKTYAQVAPDLLAPFQRAGSGYEHLKPYQQMEEYLVRLLEDGYDITKGIGAGPARDALERWGQSARTLIPQSAREAAQPGRVPMPRATYGDRGEATGFVGDEVEDYYDSLDRRIRQMGHQWGGAI